MTNRDDIYTRITNKIVTAIEAGAGKFQMPWHSTGQHCIAPVNVVSKRQYRGVNIVVLWMAKQENDYPTSEWATLKQWNSLGARVRRGEKSTEIVLLKKATTSADKEDDESRKEFFLARGFRVFNTAQVDGYVPAIIPQLPEAERIARAERVFFGLQADIRHGGDRAFYNREKDFIQLPPFANFRDVLGYYGTLSHEFIHWTGAPHRLNRDLANRFGSSAYAVEEIIAELGAAFLCAEFQLTPEPRKDHASYIASWLEVLRKDKRAIFSAASKAQQAADWLTEKVSRKEAA